jgi:hypothetical protein
MRDTSPVPPPDSWLERGVRNIEGLPAWARPPFYGVTMVYVLMLAKGGILLPVVLIVALVSGGPEAILQVLWIAVVAGLAGFAGGIAYSLAHPLLRRLGRPGTFVTCWVAVGAYLAVVVPLVGSDDPTSRHHWDVRDPVGWGIVAVCSVLFGSVLAAFFVDIGGSPSAAGSSGSGVSPVASTRRPRGDLVLRGSSSADPHDTVLEPHPVSNVVHSLAEITELERAYAIGAPTLGRAAAALLARWRLPLRDDETFLRLAFLSWYSEHEPDWLTGLDHTLPPVDVLVAERGGEETLTPEMRFTLAVLWSVFPPLAGGEAEYRERALAWAERAAAEESTSRIFREWRLLLGETQDSAGARTYVERELHARYAGRGALGDYLVHIISARLRPDGPPHPAE